MLQVTNKCLLFSAPAENFARAFHRWFAGIVPELQLGALGQLDSTSSVSGGSIITLLSCPCNPQFPLAEPVPDWEERISKLSRACAQTCGESHSPGIAPPGSRTAKFRLRSMIPGSRTVARRYQSAMNLGESSGKPGTPPVTVHQTLWLGKDWAGVRSMAITVTVVLAILALGSALSSRRPDARQ